MTKKQPSSRKTPKKRTLKIQDAPSQAQELSEDQLNGVVGGTLNPCLKTLIPCVKTVIPCIKTVLPCIKTR